MTETVNLKRRGRDYKGAAFKGVLLLSLIVGFVTLVTLLVDVFRKGWQYVDTTLGDTSQNTCYEVDAEHAFARQPLGLPESAPLPA